MATDNEPRWYIACTRSCQDKNVAEALSGAGYENYFAVQTVMRKWSDRLKKISRPVLPGIVFVRCTEKRRVDSLKTIPYITRYMSSGRGTHAPAVVPDSEIETFRLMVEKGSLPVTVGPAPLKPGDRVMVTDGPLQGREAELVETGGKSFVIARLSILGAAAIAIDRNNVIPIKQ